MAPLFQLQSTLIVMLLILGLLLRKQRNKHVKIMLLAIFWDLILVAQIELNRGAISKAAQFSHNPLLLNIHVALALFTVLLYGIMIYSGCRLLKGHTPLRPLHKRLGLTTFGLRLLVYATSFFVAN